MSSALGAVTIDSSFESGNGTGFVEISPNYYEFQIEADSNSTDRQWYYFEVNGARGRMLTFCITNIDQTNVPEHWEAARPVYSTDGGATWQRTPGEVDFNESAYTFSHTFASDSVRFAMHYPYTYTMMTEKIAQWTMDPRVTSKVLGHSVQGRNIIQLTISESGYTRGDERMGIWITTRQHGAEVTSNYTLEGLVDFLLSDDEQACALRQNAVFNIIPMVNPDGAAFGNYRDNAMGVNLNRVWDGSASMIESPEVCLVEDAIDQWVAEGNDYTFYADLHSTSNSWAHFAYHSKPSVHPPLYATPDTYGSDSDAFVALVAEHAAHFDPERGASGYVNQALSANRQKIKYGILSFIFEGVYSQINHGPRAEDWISREDHRAVGEAIGRSLVEYYNFPLPEEDSGEWVMY